MKKRNRQTGHIIKLSRHGHCIISGCATDALWLGDRSERQRPQTDRVVNLGIMTLGVVVFSGRHFYVGAWNSFKNTPRTWIL